MGLDLWEGEGQEGRTADESGAGPLLLIMLFPQLVSVVQSQGMIMFRHLSTSSGKEGRKIRRDQNRTEVWSTTQETVL